MHLSATTSAATHLGRQLPFCRRSLSLALVCRIGLILSLSSGGVRAESMVLNSNATLATAGYFQLTWSWPAAPSETVFSLNEKQLEPYSGNSSVTTVYQGTDTASAISGKSNGRYQYWVTAHSNNRIGDVYSNVVTIEVRHHPLNYALVMFFAGLVIFSAISIVIYRGTHQTK